MSLGEVEDGEMKDNQIDLPLPLLFAKLVQSKDGEETVEEATRE